MDKTVFRTFVKYVSLSVLGMIGISLYILADTYFVSKALGSIGIAALNFAIPMYSVIHGVGLMVGIGGATRFSIWMSKKFYDKGRVVFSQTIKIGFLFSLVFIVLGLFASKGLGILLGANDETLPWVTVYLKTILLFSPFFILNNVMLAFVRNDGNPRLAMRAMLFGTFSNIVLDFLFIFPLKMGMFGAALATGIAPILSLLILFLHSRQKDCRLTYIASPLRLSVVKDLIGLGLSAFIVEVSSAILLVTLNGVIFHLEGNFGVAAYAIVANVALVVFAIFTGVVQGTQPLVSYYHGERNTFKIQSVYLYAVGVSIGIAVVVYGLVFGFSSEIIRVFNSEENFVVGRLALTGIRIYFLGFIFVGITMATTMMLSATERVKEALFLSLLRGFVVIVPLVFVFSWLLGMIGVWLAFVVSEAAVSVAGVVVLKRRKIDGFII